MSRPYTSASRITFFLCLYCAQSRQNNTSLIESSLPHSFNAEIFSIRQLTTVSCESWCDKHPKAWDTKCVWSDCSDCDLCTIYRRVPVARRPPVPPPCLRWCPDHPKPWKIKCQWTVDCAGCSECSIDSAPPTERPTALLTETPTRPPTGTLTRPPTTKQLPCLSWCKDASVPLDRKCGWTDQCGGCPECNSATSSPTRRPTSKPIVRPTVITPRPTRKTSTPPTTRPTARPTTDEKNRPTRKPTASNDLPCFDYCYNLPIWEDKCSWSLNCAGCNECVVRKSPPIQGPVTTPTSPPTKLPTSRTHEPNIEPVARCENWCNRSVKDWEQKCKRLKCKTCSECQT